MKPKQLTLWPEGEKIPDDELERVFRRPPGVPTTFGRGALVVGSKGAGKTTLLRYHKETHEGIAVHLSLATELASLPKQSALGPLALQPDPMREELLINKTVSLLAISIAARLAKKSIPVPADALRQCLPEGMTPPKRTLSYDWLLQQKASVSRARLEAFGLLPKTKPLVTLLEALADPCRRKRGGLLLLLDRADLVVPSALVPVLELLDQSLGFLVLVATRPGHGGATLTRLAATSGPADLYDVVHLGLRPRSTDWLAFAESAVEAQLGERRLNNIGTDVRQRILAMSRDSIRTALEALSRIALRPGTRSVEDELQAALSDLRELHLDAVQSKVRAYHPDFRRLVTMVKRRAIEQAGPITGPVTIAIEAEPPTTLFEEATTRSLFLEAALRSAGVCMPEGKLWMPGMLPDTVEMPPLLLWEEGEPGWPCTPDTKPRHLSFVERDVLKIGGGPPPPPSIFVAFRMRFEESRAFREQLAVELARHSRLSRCVVTDGRVSVGTEWAPVIRERIGRAALVVGDVTGLRPEVVFELGFAHGLNTPVLPVLHGPEPRDALPYWLRSRQVGKYDTSAGMTEIIAGLEAHLSDPTHLAPRKTEPGVPRLVTWFRVMDWNETAKDQFETLARREGLKPEIYGADTPEEVILRRAAIASFLVVSLDGTEADAFVHFLCGAVVARPDSGYGAKKLRRRVVVLEPPDAHPRSHAAESLSRCEQTVVVTKPRELPKELAVFAEAFRTWETTPDKSGR